MFIKFILVMSLVIHNVVPEDDHDGHDHHDHGREEDLHVHDDEHDDHDHGEFKYASNIILGILEDSIHITNVTN